MAKAKYTIALNYPPAKAGGNSKSGGNSKIRDISESGDNSSDILNNDLTDQLPLASASGPKENKTIGFSQIETGQELLAEIKAEKEKLIVEKKLKINLILPSEII